MIKCNEYFSKVLSVYQNFIRYLEISLKDHACLCMELLELGDVDYNIYWHTDSKMPVFPLCHTILCLKSMHRFKETCE